MGIKSKGKGGLRARSCVVENAAKLWKAIHGVKLEEDGSD
jgi:hypothetical protein